MSSLLSSLIPRVSNSSGAPRDSLLHTTTSFNNEKSASVMLAFLVIATGYVVYFGFLASPAGLQPHKGKASRARVLRAWFLPLFGQRKWYDQRKNWVETHFGNYNTAESKRPIRMNIKHHVVNAVPGYSAAKTFFFSRDLNFNEAYQTLFAGIEAPKESKEVSRENIIDEEHEAQLNARLQLHAPAPTDIKMRELWDIKHVRNAASSARLTKDDVVRKMADDVYGCFANDFFKRSAIDFDPANPSKTAGKSGTLRIVDDIWFMIYQISLRVVGATEIVNDRANLRKYMECYWDMEKNASFWNTQMKWLPFVSNEKRTQAGKMLFTAFVTAVEMRKQENRREDDYVQTMLDGGASSLDCARWTMNALFASIITTSGAFTYTLGLASANPEIYKKLKAEIDSEVERCAKEKKLPANATILDKVSSLTVEDLEEGFGYSYWCMREAVRLNMGDFLLRKVKSKDGNGIEIEGERLRDGEFVAFPMASSHRDESVFSNPTRYDPDRWVRGEGTKPGEFWGWGAGLHPCAGMKLAKNEVKLALTLIISLMDVEPINPKNGKVYTLDNFPYPDNYSNYRVPSGPLELKYTLRGR